MSDSPTGPPSRSRRRVFLTGAGAAWPLLTASAAAQTPSRRPTPPATRRQTPWALNVRDFGAAGDGRADDTAAIQAAIDTAAREGGGTVAVPAGVYLCRTLTLRSKIHLVGSGFEATILRLRDGTNDDLLRTQDHARLTGTGAVLGPFNWSVRDLTLDGNRARNKAGCGLRIYGWGYLLSDLRVRQCAGAGIDSEWSTDDPPETELGMNTPGDSMEAQYLNLKVHDCSAGGIRFRGPHDTQFVNCVVFHGETTGILLASGKNFSSTGCQLLNCHVWGHHAYCYVVDAGYVNMVNCSGEWGSKAQVLLKQGDATIVAGRFFGDPKGRHVGIEIGTPEEVIYGTQIDARFANLNGGALKFINEGGSSQIRALIYQTSGVALVGEPSPNTSHDVQVNGIEGASFIKTAAGPLGWNGGAPIARHLSATTDWAPPALAAGAVASTEVPVDHATVGDPVAVGFSQPVPAGALLSGSVTSDGRVTVTLFNASGRPLRLSPGVLRADCWVH
ncbi:MAG: glycosyl hydrolase family 28-related protein [Isosphaeraceae bacterium]